MAALSPALSNNGAETSPITITPSSPAATTTTVTATATATETAIKSSALPTVTLQRSDPPKNLRGLNKPKCIKCGNVARSRCPYQSCKSCCSKAQNPCHIHVLKPNATLADRGASATSAIPEQQPSEVPSSGPSAKVSSIRQLSSPFAQFNNVHFPLRSRKPLTRKDALTINEWRFAKLKEYKERNIEAENEAFDRYMQNISFLEEVFDVNSERPEEEGSLASNPPTTSGEKTEMVSEMKVKLRSNPVKKDKFRKRIQYTVDQELRKLRKHDSTEGPSNLNDEGLLDLTAKPAENCWAGKGSAWTELNDRLNKARNKEELEICKQIWSEIKGQERSSCEKKTEISKEQAVLNDSSSAQESDVSLLKLVKTTGIHQDALVSMDSHFSSLEEIEDL